MAHTNKNSVTNTFIPKTCIPDSHSPDSHIPTSHSPDSHARRAPAANRHGPDSRSRDGHAPVSNPLNPGTVNPDITYPDITSHGTEPHSAPACSQRPNAPTPNVASGTEHHQLARVRPVAQTAGAQAPGHHVARAQPALAALVRYHTRAFGAPVMELALSCADLIVRATSEPARPGGALSRRTVRQVFTQTTRVLFNLDCVDPALADRALRATQSKHPELLQAIEEHLLDFKHAGQPLGNLELGVVYALARTALTVMERSALATRQTHLGSATLLAPRPTRPPASTP